MNRNEEKTKICRLCLESCDNNFGAVDDVKKNMMETLQLNLEHSVSDDELICTSCSENLQKCFEFKLSCRNTDVNLKTNQNGNENNLPEGCNICRLCLKLTYNSCYKFLCDETEGITLKGLCQYFPELALNCVRNPAVCTSCHSCLQRYFNFVRKCTDAERLKNNCQVDDATKKTMLNLVPQVMLKDTLKCETEQVDIKVSKRMESEEVKVEIKMEKADCDSNQDIPSQPLESYMHFLSCDTNTSNNIQDEPENLHRESSMNTTDIKHHHENHTFVPEYPLYQCELCKFKTRHKCWLRQHMPVHQSVATIFKCEICDFQSKHKRALKHHMLVHMNTSEVTMYRCKVCLFQTKRKSNLKEHLIIHQDPSQSTIYRCADCEFKTRRKNCLKQHTIVHQKVSKTAEYQCEVCGFSTKRKNALRRHLLVHRDTTEVTMFKCDICEFRTKHKYYLKTHMLVHQDASQMTLYPCDVCSYKANTRSRLTKHMIVHKDVSEVTIYQCNACKYKTKYKGDFKKHLLIHNDPSEVIMYRCGMCSYKTKRKDSVKPHMVRKHNLEKDAAVLTDD